MVVRVEQDTPMADSPDKLGDADLAEAVLAGETARYGVLVDRHLSSVYALVLRMVRNGADAEDLAQDAFLRAFERLHMFDTRRSFRSWLMKIATNLAINHLRARRRHRTFGLGEASAEMPDRAGEDPKAELPGRRDWQHWLGRLSELQRAAIVLFHFCEMSYAEIGQTMDMPVSTVKTHIHRGRKRLRELMTTSRMPENGTWNVAISNG